MYKPEPYFSFCIMAALNDLFKRAYTYSFSTNYLPSVWLVCIDNLSNTNTGACLAAQTSQQAGISLVIQIIATSQDAILPKRKTRVESKTHITETSKTYIHIYLSVPIQTKCIYATDIHTYTHTYTIYTHIYTYIYICIYINMHTHTNAHIHMYASEYCPILAKIYLYELDFYIRHVCIAIPVLNILC